MVTAAVSCLLQDPRAAAPQPHHSTRPLTVKAPPPPRRATRQVDASCGTGLFTRLFAQSGRFSGVVALDYSETMLQQAQSYFKQDPMLSQEG